MSKSIGTAIHRYADGSEHKLRVEIRRKGAPGWPAILLDPESGDHWYDLGIGGARQARVLANWLNLLADRLEKRGDL